MALLKPTTYEATGTRREIVTVPDLGGDVIVRGFDLRDRLTNDALNRIESLPLEAETREEASARAGASAVIRVLVDCVLGEGELPLMSKESWSSFSTEHPATAMALFYKVHELSGSGLKAVADLEKN